MSTHKNRYLIFLISFLFLLSLQSSFAIDYQTTVNGYLKTIEQQVNKMPGWESSFSLAKSNLISLEEALSRISRDIEEKRKQDPGYNVNIRLYSATGKRLKELENIKNELLDYMKKLNSDHQNMSDALSKGSSTILNNIMKSMIKYSIRIGKPDIMDLDVSGEKKDTETLQENIKSIKNMNEMMDLNRGEFNRIKQMCENVIKIIEALKPIDQKMNEILEKYKNLGKIEKIVLSGIFNGNLNGSKSSGALQITIEGNSVNGVWEGNFRSSEGSGPMSGSWSGTYDAETGILKGRISGKCRFKPQGSNSIITYNITGNWKGKAIGINKVQGNWAGKESSGTEFDRGSWEVSQ